MSAARAVEQGSRETPQPRKRRPGGMARRKHLAAIPLAAVVLALPASAAIAAKTKQTIKFTSEAPTAATVAGPKYTVTAVGGGSKKPVVLTIDKASESVCKLSGSTSGSEVSFQAAGTCTIDANQEGEGEYEAAELKQQSFAVVKKSQTITFKSSPPAKAVVKEGTYTVEASASSGLPVKITAGPSSVCAASEAGSTVSFTGEGTCTIEASQAGDAEYAAAKTEAQTVAVERKTQTITFSNPPEKAYVGGRYTVTATATSGQAVALSVMSSSNSACSVSGSTSGSTVTFERQGSCKLKAEQAGDGEYKPASATQTIAVNQLSQQITFTTAAPSGATVGATYTVGASASSGLEVSFTSVTGPVCTVSGQTTVSLVGAGTCTIVANQGGNTQYEAAAQVQMSFTVELPPPPPPPSTQTTTTAPAPIVQTQPAAVPNSNFKVIGASLSLATYAITFVEQVNDPGTFTWLLMFENGKFGVYSASVKARKCRSGWIRLDGRCRPAKVMFARGSEKVAAAGSVTFTVKPTRAGISALRQAFKRNRGLPVTAYVTFQSARGGSPVARVQSLIVKGRR